MDLRDILNFGLLSDQAYSPNRFLGLTSDAQGFTVIAKEYDASNGFGAQASYNATTNTLGIAFAGTEGWLDLANDIF